MNDFAHASGLPGVYDRTPKAPEARTGLLFAEQRFLQGAELNELQGLLHRRSAAIGGLTAAAGNRVAGAEISVALDVDPADPAAPPTTASLILAAGRIYLGGNVLAVSAARFDLVPISGDVFVGVRRKVTYISHEEDPSLYGQHPGSASEGEPGAYRQEEVLEWDVLAAGEEAGFVQVYQISDGTVIDQTPPPAFDRVLASLALYDRARGSYIVHGCSVTALGLIDGKQELSISAGEANITGWRRTRNTAFEIAFTENPDLEEVASEAHTFADSGSGTAVLTLHRPPAAAVNTVVVAKRATESISRGAVVNGTDILQFPAFEIESVTQGGTTYNPSTDYALSGDDLSWSPGGSEPAGGSTYTVTYLYYETVTPDTVTETQVTVSGGVTDKPVWVTYQSQIPRVDIVCLDQEGLPQIIEGISARKGALPPPTPDGLLKLAELHHDWFGAPAVVNNGTRVMTYDYLAAVTDLVFTLAEQLGRTRMQQSVPEAGSVSADGLFTDDFTDDSLRDNGEPQAAAANRGVLQLPVIEKFTHRAGGLETLDYTEEVVVAQLLATGQMKVNPYANFNPMPGDLRLNPNADRFTETVSEWLSPTTEQFTAAPDQAPGSTVVTRVLSSQTEAAEFLRRIEIDFSLAGFAPNEELAKLLFSGRDITPAPVLTADAAGQITGTFTIPENVPAGTHAVRAEGAAGGFAQANFTGAGEITVQTMREVTLVTVSAPPPIVINITQVNQVVNATRVVNSGGGFDSEDPDDPRNDADPLAQIFSTGRNCSMTGVNFWLAEIGDETNGLRVQLARTLNGYPTNEVLADAYVSMIGRQVGDKIEVRWDGPVAISASELYCFVVMTDDDTHALKIARLGEAVPETQQLVSQQPYTAGDLFSGSNRSTWVAHPDTDMMFEIVIAKYTSAEKVVDLFTGDLPGVTDLTVRGTVEQPSAATGFRYELERANGDVLRMAPGQHVEFAETVNETVKLRAVLSGTDYESPVLYPGTLLMGGELQPAAEYISRAFPIDGSAQIVRALIDQNLPAGSSAVIEVDAADGNWQPLSLQTTRQLGNGWSEPKFERSGWNAPNGGRVKISLTGGPAARPSVDRLRCYSV